MLQLRYHPAKKILSLLMRDWNGHRYEKAWEKERFEIPDGAWTHIALQWTPGGEAQVFLGGRLKAVLPIPRYEAIPIGDKEQENVNDLWAMEFFLGASCHAARLAAKVPKDYPLFEGAADNLCVSTGCRYKGDFEPAKDFCLDGDTRALFTFDRAFDGVSGGGFGFIPASIRALSDRVDHTLVVDGKPLQYYPAEILPENDPRKVLDILNYPVMPKPDEYRAARKTFTKRARLAAGDELSFTCGTTAYPAWVEFSNPSATEPLLYPILVNSGRLDPRSFGDLADSLAIGGMPDRDKANRVFQYVLSASDYFMNHQVCFSAGSDVPHSACYEAMIMLNSYCGFECGPLNNLAANMFATVARCPAAQTGGYGHSFEEVFFDGKNHIYDLSAQKFFPAMDNETSAYLKESGDQPGIHNRLDGSADHFIRKSTRGHGAQDPSYQEKVAMVLNPGERFRVWYANNGRMNNLQTWRKSGVYGSTSLSLDQYNFAAVACADEKRQWVKRMDRIFPHYSTGTISFDGVPAADSPALEQVRPDSFCYRVRCCYPIVWGEYAAWDRNGQPIDLELSTDFGKTFRPVPRGNDGTSRLEYRVKGRHDYLVRVKAPLAAVKRLYLRTDGEVNSRTYPGWVRPGGNAFTFKAEKGAKADVAVAWTEPAKDIVVDGGAYAGTIPGCCHGQELRTARCAARPRQAYARLRWFEAARDAARRRSGGLVRQRRSSRARASRVPDRGGRGDCRRRRREAACGDRLAERALPACGGGGTERRRGTEADGRRFRAAAHLVHVWHERRDIPLSEASCREVRGVRARPFREPSRGHAVFRSHRQPRRVPEREREGFRRRSLHQRQRGLPQGPLCAQGRTGPLEMGHHQSHRKGVRADQLFRLDHSGARLPGDGSRGHEDSV